MCANTTTCVRDPECEHAARASELRQAIKSLAEQAHSLTAAERQAAWRQILDLRDAWLASFNVISLDDSILSQLSESQKRQMRAEVEAPLFALKLLLGVEALSERSCVLLYGEFRQLHRCRRPFHMHGPKSIHYANCDDTTDCLVRLASGDYANKGEALSLLNSLKILHRSEARVQQSLFHQEGVLQPA